MNLLSHVWIDPLTYNFSRMSLFNYESTFSRTDWLSHVWPCTHKPFHLWICFLRHALTVSAGLSLAHEPFLVWIHFLTYGLTLSQLLSDAWASSRMNLLSHVWIDSLTHASHEWAVSRINLRSLCGLTLSPMMSHESDFSPMNLISHVCIDSFTSGFTHVSLCTYKSAF